MARSGARASASATLFLPDQAGDGRSGQQHDGDDERREPGVDDVGEAQDGGRDRVADGEEAEQPGDAEHADPDAGALALLRDLGLGEPDLGADELGDLLGELVDECAEGLTLWRSVLSSHVSTFPNPAPDHQPRSPEGVREQVGGVVETRRRSVGARP